MRKKKGIFRLGVVVCTVALCALCFAANTVFGEETSEEAGRKPAQGELKIEGRYIKRLTLERRGGEKVTFDQPGESIKVAVGKYRLREVQLESGYSCREWMVPDQNWIEVGEDKPAVLKAGAPLKQVVTAQRQGRLLTLNYKVLGIGGETYTGYDRSKPPTFTVYKGDERITSGTFEYG